MSGLETLTLNSLVLQRRLLKLISSLGFKLTPPLVIIILSVHCELQNHEIFMTKISFQRKITQLKNFLSSKISGYAVFILVSRSQTAEKSDLHGYGRLYIQIEVWALTSYTIFKLAFMQVHSAFCRSIYLL